MNIRSKAVASKKSYRRNKTRTRNPRVWNPMRPPCPSCPPRPLRYKDAELALQRAGRVGDAAALGPQNEELLTVSLEAAKGVVETLVASFAAESDPSLYVHAYDRLVAWVDGAIDMYRVRR
eukprot:242424-Chlamydomonas_euryale.AAC.1